uniref:Ribosomal protein S9, putative n=1 Tax=Arundo donax TaxID=35708 RepID=A0A0A9E4P8_ARUDO
MVFPRIDLIERTTLSFNPLDPFPKHGRGKGILLLLPTQRPLLIVASPSRLSTRGGRRHRLLVYLIEHVSILTIVRAEALRPGLLGGGGTRGS